MICCSKSYIDTKRGNPLLTPEAAYSVAWNALSPEQKAAVRREEAAAAAAKELADRQYAASVADKSDFRKETIMSQDIVGTLVRKIIHGGDTGISEADLTKIGFEHAQKFRRDNETREQAFARYYMDDADFRKAIAIANGRPVDHGNYQHTIEKADVADALGELNKLAADLRKRKPELSTAQAFAKVYEMHPELAHAERDQNRPVA